MISPSTSESANVLEPVTTTTSAEAAPSLRHPLPEEPLVKVEAGRSRPIFDLGSLWAYRELLYFLTWRDIKVRYKQTVLGAT